MWEEIMPVILMDYYMRRVSVQLKLNKRLHCGSRAKSLVVVCFRLCHQCPDPTAALWFALQSR